MTDDDPITLTWTFRRGDDQIDVRRTSQHDTTRLIINGPTGARTLDFATHEALVVAHSALEDHLISDGWRFETFAPERRHEMLGPPPAIADRRAFRTVASLTKR